MTGINQQVIHMNQAWPDNTSNINFVEPQQKLSINNLPKIAICVPYNSKWEPEWVDTTYAPLRYTTSDWCIKIAVMSKAPSIPVARDILVKHAMELGCDYIFWLDSDVLFESPSDPNIALRTLYQVINKDPNSKDGKIVSGLYRARKKDGFTYCMWTRAPNNIKGYVAIEKWTGNWIQVDVTGLGCCLMDLKVFKDVPQPYFQWNMKEDISEDFYFLEKAKSYGYNLHCFTDVKMSHMAHTKIKSDGTIVMVEM